MSGNKMNKEMERLLDEKSKERFGRRRSVCLRFKTCVICGEDAKDFRSPQTKQEYSVTAVCQNCQDHMSNTFEQEQEDEEEFHFLKQREFWC